MYNSIGGQEVKLGYEKRLYSLILMPGLIFVMFKKNIIGITSLILNVILVQHYAQGAPDA